MATHVRADVRARTPLELMDVRSHQTPTCIVLSTRVHVHVHVLAHIHVHVAAGCHVHVHEAHAEGGTHQDSTTHSASSNFRNSEV
jgi:hypothetical protein